MAEHVLKGNPVREIVIDGEPYEMEVGNYTIVLEAKEWAEGVTELMRKDAFDLDDAKRLADGGAAIVAAALGDDGARRLMGGRNRLNLMRLLGVLDIIVEEFASDEGIRAQEEAILSFARTADED